MINQTTLARRNGQRKAVRRRARGWRHVGAYVAGVVVGGIIPMITWDIAHHQAAGQPMLWMAVAGGLGYSAPMVAQFFSRYVGMMKSVGFVLSLEVAMTFTSEITSLSALAVLVAFNAFILANRFTND